jgi:hypothetical protein
MHDYLYLFVFFCHPAPSFAPPFVLSTSHSCNSFSSLELALVIGCNVLSFWASSLLSSFLFVSVLFFVVKPTTTYILTVASQAIEHSQFIIIGTLRSLGQAD